MQKESTASHGVKWGIIIGAVYCIFLLLRYATGVKNPILFSIWAICGYLVVLVLMLVEGFSLRKQLGGYIELKDVFKALFVSVIIFEFISALFQYIYISYVNPNFFHQYSDAMEEFMSRQNLSQDKIDKALSTLRDQADHKMTIMDLLKTFLFGIAVSGIFAFLFSLIIKRKGDPFASGGQDQLLEAQS